MSDYMIALLVAFFYVGGVIYTLAMLRQWNCSRLVEVVVSVIWFVALPAIGWLIVAPTRGGKPIRQMCGG